MMDLCPSSSLVLFDLFVNILAHNLAEPAYEADVAQLEYKLVAGEHGLVIRLKGFNHKLPVRTRAHGCTELHRAFQPPVVLHSQRGSRITETSWGKSFCS